MTTAYPLAWPLGWPRHSSPRQYAKFEKMTKTFDTERQLSTSRKRELSVTDGTARVTAELRRMGLPDSAVVISTNVALRLDGLPRSGQREPEDPGVAVYWSTRKGERKVMAIDRYTRVADNLAAVAATLEALRGIERWGGGQILDRAFAGFAALPAPGQTTARGWREVLEVSPDEIDIEVVKRQYRRLSSVHHPDRGGDSGAMSTLNWAWAQAQDTLAGRHA